jgi:hypothetical protein
VIVDQLITHESVLRQVRAMRREHGAVPYLDRAYPER